MPRLCNRGHSRERQKEREAGFCTTMQFLALPASIDHCKKVSGYGVREIELTIRDRLGVFALGIEDLGPLIQESFEKDTVRPHCAVSWPASQAVAYSLSAMLSESGSVASLRKVFEVGAGNGVASLCAARLGANVTATDIHPLALALVKSLDPFAAFSSFLF